MIRTYSVVFPNGQVDEFSGDYLEASTYSGCLSFIDYHGKSLVTFGPTAWHSYKEVTE